MTITLEQSMLNEITDYYHSKEEDILATFEKSKYLWHNDPYVFDWQWVFSPIEKLAWNAIRTKGRIVLYPQYPVLNYRLDFANPGLKIGLELDGAEFHDKENDKRRDKNLYEIGWTVYRISGKEMMRTTYVDFYDDGFDKYDIEKWIMDTGDGVIEAIKTIYFSSNITEEYTPEFVRTCQRSLNFHQLVKPIIYY